MLTDNFLIIERPHFSPFVGGVQRIYRFPDGHGLSVVNGPGLHIYPFAWEIAVLESVSESGDSFSLTYDTGLTNDVEVFETDEEANAFILSAINHFTT